MGDLEKAEETLSDSADKGNADFAPDRAVQSCTRAVGELPLRGTTGELVLSDSRETVSVSDDRRHADFGLGSRVLFAARGAGAGEVSGDEVNG